MKIVAICILHRDLDSTLRTKTEPYLLSCEYNLDDVSFWQRNGVREIASFVSRTVVSRAEIGTMMSVSHQQYVCHTRVWQNGLSIAVLADDEYPSRVAFSLIQATFEIFNQSVKEEQWKSLYQDTQFKIDGLANLLAKYQKPEEVDKILKIQKDLESTKKILLKSIDNLLERGEKLEDMAAKSEHLSFQSKAFMAQSQKMNSCCTLL